MPSLRATLKLNENEFSGEANGREWLGFKGGWQRRSYQPPRLEPGVRTTRQQEIPM